MLHYKLHLFYLGYEMNWLNSINQGRLRTQSKSLLKMAYSETTN